MKKYYLLSLGGVVGYKAARTFDTKKNARAFSRMLSRELKIGLSMFEVVALDDATDNTDILLEMAREFTKDYARKAIKQHGKYKYLYNDHSVLMNTDRTPYLYNKNDKEMQKAIADAPCTFDILELREPCGFIDALSALVDAITEIKHEYENKGRGMVI